MLLESYGHWWLSSSMIIKQYSQSFNKSILVGRSKFWIFKCCPRVYGQIELMKLDFYLLILDTCYMNLMTHFFLIRYLASLFSNGLKTPWGKEVLHKKPQVNELWLALMMISLTHVTKCHALKPHSNLLMTKALVGAIELSIK
jgi:hypothetical protein